MHRHTRHAATVATVAPALLASLAIAAPGAQATATALPQVNMEAVLKAAQLDPHRTSTTPLAEARSSVLLVERALHARGLLASKWVDGYFGSSTTSAWISWERRVHPGSTDASKVNGLPNYEELSKLGARRYTIVRPVFAGKWVTEDGKPVSQRTVAMLRRAERISGTTMYVVQGRGNASASAGTHGGGGAIDIRTKDRPTKTAARVAALRKVGFAAWYRNWSGNQHIHAVAVSDPGLAKAAHDDLCQVYQHWAGGEGLNCGNSTAGKDRPWRTWEMTLRGQ